MRDPDYALEDLLEMRRLAKEDEPKPGPSFWESHRCVGCGDGKRKCKEGRWNHCGWPQARND